MYFWGRMSAEQVMHFSDVNHLFLTFLFRLWQSVLFEVMVSFLEQLCQVRIGLWKMDKLQ